MRIVVYLHLFPPEHNAGSETTVHAAMRAMVDRGHEVRVICDKSQTAPYVVDGIQVLRPPRRNQQAWLQAEIRWGDILITHLDVTSQAMAIARTVNIPLVHFVHNSAQLDYWHVKEKAYDGERNWAASCRLVIFNSHWIQELAEWPGDQIVLHPVVEPHHYQCETGDSVTLVNPTSGKGATVFYDLAREMPDVKFVTAQGGYGVQVKCPSTGREEERAFHSFYDASGMEQACRGLPNVTHLKNDPDIRNVFRRTRVLLMPSDYESYGRVGIEAACAGIPTIAHPTPGLKEAFGDAAIFCDRNDVQAWKDQLERLLTDETYYKRWSNRGLELAASLTPESEFDRLEMALLNTKTLWEGRQGEMKVWTSEHRWYKTVTGNLTTDRNEANGGSLAATVGMQLPEDEAKAKGLWQAQEQMSSKMVAGPEENKAVKSPRKTKAA
jgi:glycosyltransferase involved in cell wall biosynthesis